MLNNADYVVVLDPKMIKAVNVEAGLAKNGLVVVNSPTKPELGHPCVYFDATTIALEVLGRPITNTVMLGGFVAGTGGLIKLESVEKGARFVLGKKMPEKVLELNLAAIRRAFEEVRNARA